jgi:ABC-type transporter Mla maintaining outer membrane lipid asymmetry ATPase subunit MlaF
VAALAPLVEFAGVSLEVGGRRFLDRVDLALGRGETLVVAGPPGSGKSFVLRLILGLPGMQRADQVRLWGEVRFEGESVFALSAGRLQQVRRRLGAIMRGGGLIDNMDLRRNITLPLYYHQSEVLRAERIEARCTQLMAGLGIAQLDRPGRRPVTLNQEERLCVSLARALIGEPALLLADDPTAGLDAGAAARLLDHFWAPPGRDGGFPLTRLIAAASLAPYLGREARFALLREGRLEVLGDRRAVLESGDPWVRRERECLAL